MKHEFEKLAGYEVTWEDYNNIIEPMYMATNLNKQDFVKTLNKQRFAVTSQEKYVGKLKMLARSLKDTCEHYTDTETLQEFTKTIFAYIDRMWGIYGYKDVNYTVEHGYTYEHLGVCRGCCYPKRITFYSTNNYKTLQVLELF